MQQVFKNAIHHQETTVIGQRLLPLCCGHVYTLMVCASPFVTGGPVEDGDLAVAVGVCSRSFEDGQAWLAAPDILDQSVRTAVSMASMDLPAELAKFREYVSYNSILPERWSKKTGGGTLHPWPMVVAVSIMPLVGESRAWNMPLPLAVSYQSALGEVQYGDRTLVSESDEALRERARKEYAERQAA